MCCCYYSDVGTHDLVHNRTHSHMRHLNVQSSDSLSLVTFMFHMRSIRGRHRVRERAMWWPNNIFFAASVGRHKRSWWNFLTQPDYKILCEVEPKRMHYVRRTAAPFSPSVSAAARYKLSNRQTLGEGIFLSVNKSVHMSCKNDTCNWNKVAVSKFVR